MAVAGCPSLPGTSAEDAAAAKETLEQAAAPMETIESLGFSLVATGEANGQRFSITMQGAGYLEGTALGPAVSTDALDGLGDVHAELYVSEATDHLRAAHVVLTLEQDGQTANLVLTIT